jgi:carboxyl-terminal PDZ ligand of neuronal nitric oxide synthase protein
MRRSYDQVNDVHDNRVPIYSEEAFQYGVLFKAKFIGSLEISRPSSKLDIITAMRRIRYEFKVKGIKKIRAHMYMSLDGVKVTRRKKNRRRKHYTDEQLFIMHHPIYRIFYVSHDSQDQRIFSYITRESPSNTFRCNVFKAKKKSLALHIVRALGQAFDVCHKLNPRPQVKDQEKKEERKDGEREVKETDIDEEEEVTVGEELQSTVKVTDLDALTEEQERRKEGDLIKFPVTFDEDDAGFNWASQMGSTKPNGNLLETQGLLSNPFSTHDQESWEAEKQQLYSHIQVLQKQLWEETEARVEAQTRVEHLLKQNQELMDHLQKMVGQSQTKEGVSSPPPSEDANLLHTHVEALLMKSQSPEGRVPGVPSHTGSSSQPANVDSFDPLDSGTPEVTVGAN